MRITNNMLNSQLNKNSGLSKEKRITASAKRAARDVFMRSSLLTGSGALGSSLYNDWSAIKSRHDSLQALRVQYRKASDLMKLDKYKPLKGDMDIWTAFVNGEIDEKDLDKILKKMEEEAAKQEAAGEETTKEVESNEVAGTEGAGEEVEDKEAVGTEGVEGEVEDKEAIKRC